MNRQSGTYPTLKQAFWLLLVFFAITIAVGIIVELTASLTLHGRQTFAQKEEARFIAIGAVGYTLTLAWAIRKARAPLGEIFPFNHVSAGDIWPTVLSMFGLVIILEEAANLASRALPSWIPEISNSLIGGFETLPWGVTALVVVIGPIAEELLFRGIVLRGFLSRYSTRKTVLASALLFGLVHVNPVQVASTAILGVLLGWWRTRTRSLILPILAHSLYNALALSTLGLPWVGLPNNAGVTEALMLHPLWFDVIGVLLFAAGILMSDRVSKTQIPARIGA